MDYYIDVLIRIHSVALPSFIALLMSWYVLEWMKKTFIFVSRKMKNCLLAWNLHGINSLLQNNNEFVCFIGQLTEIHHSGCIGLIICKLFLQFFLQKVFSKIDEKKGLSYLGALLTRPTWLIHTSFLPSKWNLYPKIPFLA